LMGFTPVERPLVVGDGACAQTVDLSLALAPRQAFGAAQGRAATTPDAPLTSSARAPQQAAVPAGGRGTRTPAGNGRGAQRGFETVQVQPQADQAGNGAAPERESEDTAAT